MIGKSFFRKFDPRSETDSCHPNGCQEEYLYTYDAKEYAL
jgi:hypothetical protein